MRGWTTLWAVALLTFLQGCSSTIDPPPPDPINAVLVTGVPTSPLLVGSTAQLAATAVNATGGTVAGATFTWRASDATVASVSSGGLVTATGPGPVTITATSGGKDGSAVLDVRAGGSVGPAGGILTLMNGAVTLEVPPNSLNQTVMVLVRPTVDPANNPRVVPGTIVELAPEGTSFVQGATLTLRYETARLPAQVTENALQLYGVAGGAWGLIASSTVNTGTKTVVGVIGRTGVYAAAGTGVDRIELIGAGLEGALYATQTTQFGVELFDASGNRLTGRTVTWSTTDATKVSVAGGLVTAIAPGSATIKAESDGKSASTMITVLSRPTADWTSASEWVTFQGNPDHTGFVAVIADPVGFAERWVKDLTPGVTLNPVTAGSNAVFVSTNAYFGTQRALGLSVATGAVLWSRDFGPIHGVHPPAFGGGTVYLTTSGHGDSYLYALDATSGLLKFRSPYGNQWSRYYAPVVLGQRVYMAGGSYDGMYAFDAVTGAEKWFASTSQFNEWTPAVRGGLAYAYTQQQITAVDVATGVESFTIADPKFEWNGYSMWTAPVLGPANDLYAVQGGRLIAFDLAARSIKWEKKSQFTGTATVAENVIYVVNGGQLEARSPADGSLLWAWDPPQGDLVGTTIATRNLVFAATATRTYAIDLGAKRQVWSHPAGGQLALSGQGVLFIAGADGKLTAIAAR